MEPKRFVGHSLWKDRAMDGSGLSELDEAHASLMRKYRGLIEHVEQLPFLAPREDVEGRGDRLIYRSVTPRFLVRSFVEAHISARLRQLRDVYRWLQQGAEGQEREPERRWFGEKEGQLDKIRESFRPWSRLRLTAAVVGPPLATAVAAQLGGDSLWGALFTAEPSAIVSTLEWLAIFSALFGLWAAVFCARSFEYKRALLLGGPEAPTIEEKSEPVFNAYAAEDRLWSVLDTRKKLEPRVDTLSQAGMFGVAALGELGMAVAGSFEGVGIAGACMCGFFSVATLRHDRNRRFR
jgi:hypothetical protein